jgi:hypothetical protein
MSDDPKPEEPEEPAIEVLPDTPESRRARRWLFRSLLALALVNLGLLTWVVVTGLLARRGSGAP